MSFQSRPFSMVPRTVMSVLTFVVLIFTSPAVAVTVPGDYATIQSALDDLKNGSLPSGEIIEVLPGTYYEALTYADAPKSFTLRSTAGAELTTIDAAGTGRSAIFIRDTAANIHIEGFTVTGGDSLSGAGLNFFNASATLSGLIVEENNGYHGGGIQLNGSTTTIDNCTFRNNFASKSGGAIAVVGGSDVTIVDSRIMDNFAGVVDPIGSGGGVRIGNSSVTIIRTEITGNHAKFAGGGIFAIGEFDSPFGVTTLTVEDSLVSKNTVIHEPGQPIGAGGGIHIEANVTASVTDSIIEDNVSSGKGGGLNTFQAHFQVTGTLVQYNQAIGGTGGGVHGFSAPPSGATAVIIDSVIRNNSALNAGGISMGGSNCANGGVCADLAIDRVLIDNNTAANYGGGVNIDDAVMSALDSQVLRNRVTDPVGGTGGGFRITTSTLDIYNTSVSGNFAGVSGGGLYLGNAAVISVDMSNIYANAVAESDKGGGMHTSSAGPPDGLIQNSVIANNSGFQIREQSCPPELPSPILSYAYNNISDPYSALYKSPCWPPEEVYDIEVFNALSPGVKTIGNYDDTPDFLVFSGTPLPRGGSVLAWTRPGSDTVEILNLGSFTGPVGSVDVFPACTSTYELDSASTTVAGTDASELDIIDQNPRGHKIIEATDRILIQNTNIASGVDITLKAKNSISISNQFAVELGGSLHLQIDPILCSETP